MTIESEEKVMEFICVGGLSLLTVEKECFKRMLKHFAPAFKLRFGF
jgi:hypothetical protein